MAGNASEPTPYTIVALPSVGPKRQYRLTRHDRVWAYISEAEEGGTLWLYCWACHMADCVHVQAVHDYRSAESDVHAP